MSTRITEHKRTRGSGKCSTCGGDIVPGEYYLQLIAIHEDWVDSNYHRETAHSDCVASDPSWEIHNSDSLEARHDRMAYLRKVRGDWMVPGAKVILTMAGSEPELGTLWDGSGSYVVVKSARNPKGGIYGRLEVEPAPLLF
jgi:hypothetical protein